MHGRLPPHGMYPCGVAGVRVRHLALDSGMRVRVLEAGAAEAAPVVLLHGWGGSAYMFRRGIERLPSLGFRAIVPDLRGFGLSDKPTSAGAYTRAAFVSDFVGLLDALELDRVALVGQSMGGGIALAAALEHPRRVRALALVNPVCLAAVPMVRLSPLLPGWLLGGLGWRAVPRWVVRVILRRLAYARPDAVSPRDVDEYWAPSQFNGYVHALCACLSEFDWNPLEPARLRELDMRIELVLGAADRLVSAQASAHAAARVPRIGATTLPGGHCVHEELPDLVYPLIAGALA